MILGPAPLGHPSATTGGILPRMTTTRLARAEDLPLLAGIEDAGDTLFAERFGGVDWPAASSGEERAAEPGILLVAVDDDGTVGGFTHVPGIAIRRPCRPSPIRCSVSRLGSSRAGSGSSSTYACRA